MTPHAEMPEVPVVCKELERVIRCVRAVARGAGQLPARVPGVGLAADRMGISVKKSDYMVSGLPHMAGQTEIGWEFPGPERPVGAMRAVACSAHPHRKGAVLVL